SAMPIRFRCAYCNQLMGIARRKAGSVVRCPSCAGQIIVPNPEGGEGSGSQIREENAPLFERSDFGKIFDSAAGTKQGPQPAAPPRPMAEPSPAAAPPVPPLPVETRGEPVKQEYDLERVEPTLLTPDGTISARPGIWISPTLATVFSILAVILLALVFAAGL